jgi:ATP synthase protein I
VALSIAAGAGGGYWLDTRLGTRPWLTIVGVVLGAVVAFTAMIRLLAWASKTRGADGNRKTD